MFPTDLVLVAFSTGLLFGLSLILSIGPQNLRLIETGLQHRNVAAVATVGWMSEVVIVSVGIGGGGILLAGMPAISEGFRLAGAAFLLWCGLAAMRRKPVPSDMKRDGPVSRTSAVLGMLAVTWLNPLVYVEVMLLVGVMSSGFSDAARVWFGAGFLIASAVRFYGWGVAGRFIAPLLVRPAARRCFDLASGAVLVGLGLVLTHQVIAG